jgi:hypothetical protein
MEVEENLLPVVVVAAEEDRQASLAAVVVEVQEEVHCQSSLAVLEVVLFDQHQ